jgi:hypothetical protein
MRRLWTIAGILTLAAAAQGASWTWQQVPMRGNLETGQNPFFLAFHPGLQKILLTLDSGSGEVLSYTLDPPRWVHLGTDAMSVPSGGFGYFYFKTQGLVYDHNLEAPVLFGISQENAPGTSVMMMPFAATPNAQWTGAYPNWKEMDPTETGGFVTAYDTLRRKTVILGLSFPGELGWWTQEFDGRAFSPTAQPGTWTFASGVAGFDPQSGRTVYFGKVRYNHDLETAEYDGTAWNLVETTQSPLRRGTMTPLAHVPALGGLVGVENTVEGAVTWLYKEGDWRVLSVDQALLLRPHAQIAYNEARGRLVLFGGTPSGGDSASVVWELVLVSGHSRPVEKP